MRSCLRAASLQLIAKFLLYGRREKGIFALLQETKDKSLILREQAELESAPFLFSEDELPKIDKTKPKFHCTGERLFRDRRDVYEAVVKLLAEPGVSIRTICRECHVSDHTIRSVAAREGIAIAAAKKEVLANTRHGLRLATERVIETIPEASTRDALIGVGILAEKEALLSGGPTIRIDIERVDLPGQLTQLLREVEAKFKAAQANQIGLDRKTSAQKALMNGDRDDGCDAQNCAGTAVIEAEAALDCR
jgi:transposase-like protein